ncbi:alpha/beta hydrolase family protein [Rhizohabitans arisaemae]|uniref:alpha/beta hydrolase family protein n=1 Tax=Rhizohabitans arisaemae TaxID=2720610 RepID=UPI0024B2644E|nr:S9 family peptidase [Rhizohabitans arisaemae]
MLSGPSAAELYADCDVAGIGLAPDGSRVGVVTNHAYGGRLTVLDWRRRVRTTVATLSGGISAHAWCPDNSTIFLTGSPDPGGAERLLMAELGAGPLTPVALDGEPTLMDPDLHRARGVVVRTGGGLHRVVPGDGRGPVVIPIDVPPEVDRCLFDRRDEPRCGIRWDPDGTLVVFSRDHATGRWPEVRRFAPPDSLLTHPGDVTADGAGLFLHGPLGAKHLRLAILDLGTGTLRIVAEQPGRDADAVLLHPVDQHPMAIRTVGVRRGHLPLTASAAADLHRLGTLYPADYRVIATSADGETWLVRYDADRMPPRYVVWDRRNRSAHPVPRHRRTVAARRLARTRPYRIEASDGLPLEGYLTLPKRGPGPAVVLPHGGPWARDDWEYNPDVQWLASRGYACLQLNFRGSEGYGVDHMNAADRDWGGRMQSDLTDAVRWAVAAGYADPARLAIMGTSYGGYAALAAATMGPKVFAASVAVCAASDLVALTEPFTRERSYLHALFLHRLGHPDRDRDLLAARSPLTHAAACHTPVLLVHGARDRLMPVTQAERMAAALRESGSPCRLAVFPDEGHGIRRPANRVILARLVDRFLRSRFRRQ